MWKTRKKLLLNKYLSGESVCKGEGREVEEKEKEWGEGKRREGRRDKEYTGTSKGVTL